MQEKVNVIHLYDCMIKLGLKILIVEMVISMIVMRTYYIVTYYIVSKLHNTSMIFLFKY